MKNAISFGAIIGLVLVSVFTFKQVVDSKVAISEISAQSQSAATVVSAQTLSAAQLAQQETSYINSLRASISSPGTTTTSYLNSLASTNCQLRSALSVPCPGAAASTSLSITFSPDTPPNQVVVVSESNDTDGIVLLEGRIEAQGSDDLTINSLPITLTTVGGASVSAIANSATLVINGEEYVENVAISGLTGVVTFDNLALVINGGDRIEFVVKVDVNDIEPGQFDNGDSLDADLTAANRGNISVVDSMGNALTASQKIGAANGQAQVFRSSGLGLLLVSQSSTWSEVDGSGNDTGQFTLNVQVTAVGEDLYIAKSAASTKNTSPSVAGLYYHIESPNADGLVVGAGTRTHTVTRVSGGSDVGNYIKIPAGQSATLRLVVNYDPAAAGPFRLQLHALNFAKTAAAGTTQYLATPTQDFQTSISQILN